MEKERVTSGLNQKLNDFLEELINSNKENAIDELIHFCDRNGLDVVSVGEFIKTNQVLKQKFQSDAENLNFLKKTAKLPV